MQKKVLENAWYFSTRLLEVQRHNLNVESFAYKQVFCICLFFALANISYQKRYLNRSVTYLLHYYKFKNINTSYWLGNQAHTVRKWIYIGHKLPRTFDSSLSLYDINAYKKCLEKLIWTKKKNHVPHRGIEPAPSLIRSGLARIKWKMSSVLPTELLGHLYNYATI